MTGPLVRTRVLVVHSHAVMLAGLKALLAAEGDIDVVGEAGTIERACFELHAHQPDVVLLSLEEDEGTEGIELLLEHRPAARILVLCPPTTRAPRRARSPRAPAATSRPRAPPARWPQPSASSRPATSTSTPCSAPASSPR